MDGKDNISLNVQDEISSDIDAIKSAVIKLHKNKKDEVPKYLDDLKKEKENKEKETTIDNDFLIYLGSIKSSVK